MGNLRKCSDSLECRRLREHMAIYSVMFSAHGKVQVMGCRRRRSVIAVGHVEDYPEKDETTVNLTQGDSRATVKFLQVGSIFTQVSDRCVMVLNGKKGLQLQVEAHGVWE